MAFEVAAPEVLLCDTSFLVHLEKSKRDSTRYVHWARTDLDRISQAILAITPFTLAEIRFGYVRRRWGPGRVAVIEHQLSSFVVVPLDEKVIDTYVDLRVRCADAGRPMGYHDCWIVATAISQAIPLVSCDQGMRDRGAELLFLEPPK